MRVLIDLTDLLPAQMGGIEVYARDLIHGFLDKKYQQHQFTLLVQKQHRGYFGKLAPHVNYRVVDQWPIGKLLMKRGRLKRAWLGLQKINSTNFDVIHFPFQAVRFTIPGVPTIVSIMDIQHETYPKFFSPEELLSRRSIYPYSVKQATRVVSISKFTAHELTTHYAVPADKIDVVYLSISPNVTTKKAIKRPILYYPAASWPHKNHLKLIQAFAAFHAKNTEYELHLTGAQKQATPEIDALVVKLGLSRSVIQHGFVSQDAVRNLFRTSRALIFPSLYEGFGIPIVEAMSYGLPVACSDLPVLREVGGDGVLLFDPNSVSAITEAMEKVALDTSVRSRIVKGGIKNKARFTIEKMAAGTLAAYQKAVAQK